MHFQKGQDALTEFVSVLCSISAALWLYLSLLHHGYWRADQRLDLGAHKRLTGPAPAVAVVVPARNEADVIAGTVRGLLGQDYAGVLRVIVVDDASEDGTGEAARRAAEPLITDRRRFTLVAAAPLPPGWSGKLWALQTGLDSGIGPEVRYLLFTDADIEHDPGSVSRLVGHALARDLDLVSVMVLLWHRGAWAGLLIPAFVYFFQKLYPFRAVYDPADDTAAAAGGCVLLRRAAFEQAGGLAPIRSALIDDCALARLIKHRPDGRRPIWLGLTDRVISRRPYQGLAAVWRMVARTAFDQLGYSALALAGCVLGMAVLYVLPVAAVLAALAGLAPVTAGLLGGLAWALMAASFLPTLRLYGKPAVLAALLPLAGLVYTAMTVSSAVDYWRGRGGHWKGRVQADLSPDGPA